MRGLQHSTTCCCSPRRALSSTMLLPRRAPRSWRHTRRTLCSPSSAACAAPRRRAWRGARSARHPDAHLFIHDRGDRAERIGGRFVWTSEKAILSAGCPSHSRTWKWWEPQQSSRSACLRPSACGRRAISLAMSREMLCQCRQATRCRALGRCSPPTAAQRCSPPVSTHRDRWCPCWRHQCWISLDRSCPWTPVWTQRARRYWSGLRRWRWAHANHARGTHNMPARTCTPLHHSAPRNARIVRHACSSTGSHTRLTPPIRRAGLLVLGRLLRPAWQGVGAGLTQTRTLTLPPNP